MSTHIAKSALIQSAIGLAFLAMFAAGPALAGLHPSYDYDAPIDTVAFYPGATYDETIPHPDDVLPYAVGKWPNRYDEIVHYIEVLASASDRVVIEPHEMTYEGRQLYNVFISTPENLQAINEHRDNMSRLADPSSLAGGDLDAAVSNQPAFAWLGYSIHGDEISGADAASMLCYHLAAATDSATLHLLENVIIIIDPSENPDGRERYLSMLQTYKSHVPNYDRRAAQHGGVWPWGRGNHYWFDLNRDWILLRHPETRGRVKTILDFNPVTVVDAHEMGSNATFLFTPPREPINYNTPQNVLKWWQVFQSEQADAFDQRGWPYYVGEWHEQWYPGYGSAWATFFGAVGILYEQAGVDGELVRQSNDYILTYHESVNHQFTSSLANLFTTANHRSQLLRDYYNTRRNVAEQGRQSRLAYVFVPDDDEIKTQRFVESLRGQGIVVEQAQDAFAIPDAKSIYGKSEKSKRFPKGSIIVRTAQPMGALIKAILDFDPRLNLAFLKEERRELEKHNETRMYEVSAWSLPLAWDMDAWQTTASFTVATEAIDEFVLSGGNLINPDARYAFVIDMEGEKTFQALNRLFNDRVIVYAARKPFTVDGYSFKAGALSIRKRGNSDDLVSRLESIASDIGIDIVGVNTGASSDGSYLGAPTFDLMRQPRVAILIGPPLSFNSAGVNWFMVDYELQIPHSLLRIDELAGTDLAKYNVLLMPSSWGSGLSSTLTRRATSRLKDWVKDGGTLICMGSAAVWAADTATGLSSVKLKRQTLEDLSDFDRWVDRETRAEAPPVDTMALWHPEKVAAKKADEKAGGKPSKEDLEDLDQWQRKFHPRGVIMRVELDSEDWLAFGMKAQVPAILYTSYAFLSDDNVKTTARFADENQLRISGLLWPEARTRWAKTAYAAHEPSGKGQVVLFAGDPNTRGYFYGTRKLLVNAIMYGPGMGSRFDGPYE